MNLSRSILLWMSENNWMKTNVPKWWFVRKALKKFMPGDSIEDALNASESFSVIGIPTVFTKLGENITDLSEAAGVGDHYLDLIDKIAARNLDIEISVKLTQLGFDFSFEETLKNFSAIAEKTKQKLGNVVFIDMEGSAYTQRTLDFYHAIKDKHDNIGICLQAYLYRTKSDIDKLLKLSPSIRLVKGAYKENPEIAFPQKSLVDNNYFTLAQSLIKHVKEQNIRVIYASHDQKLINQIIEESKRVGLDKNQLEFQMLYGIKTSLQTQLAKDGFKVRVLIAYGDSWYPWYMRRLAERPANIWFVIKNIF